MNERSSHALSFLGSRWWTVLASAAVVAFAYSLCIRGINLSDEGYLLSQVLDMLEGKVLYRDMDAFVTPGIWFFLAGLFQIFEPSVLTSRILSFAGYLGTIYVSFRIVAGLASRAAAWATVGLLMVFSIWAFPAWTMVFYSPFAVLFALAALDRLLESRKDHASRNLVLSGVFLGLSVLCKQNYGAFASAGAFVSLIAFRLEARESIREVGVGLVGDCLRLSVGGLAVLLPSIGYLAYHGALAAAFDSLVIHPFVFMSRQDIPFPGPSMLFGATPLHGVDGLTYGAYSYNQAPNPFYSTKPVLSVFRSLRVMERLHILLFWLPAFGLALGGFLALRPSEARRPIDGKLIAVLSIAAFVFLGVFPRADFNHLINVYQPVVVAFVVVVHRYFSRSDRPRTRLTQVAIGLASALLFLYTTIAGFWYEHTIRHLNSQVSSPFGGVFVTSIDRSLIDFQVDKIREMTGEGEFVLTVPGLAMLNFLSDRRMPGRYYNLYEHHIAHDDGQGVVDAAEAHSVDLVVADYNNFFSDRVGLRVYAPELARYLRTHFESVFDVAGGKYQYLKRRSTPRSEPESVDLIDTCDLHEDGSTYTREHLLFSSLYQTRNTERPAVPIDTKCTFLVPKRGEVVFSLGYRRPNAAQRIATITAEIWAIDGDQSEPLLAHVIPVESQKGWSSPPATEIRVDLAKFAGREVTLLFRSTFHGAARLSPLSIGGFSLIWHDLRIETRRNRVLLIGIDGATFRVINPLIAAGRLPNLAALRRDGVSGPLRSAFPLVSPRIWTTIATGKVPLQHGIHHWVKKGEDGSTQLNLGTDRLVPALWNITSAHDVTSGVVNWLNTYPPEKTLGVIVSDFAIAGQREDREKLFAGNQAPEARPDAVVSYPEDWTEKVHRLTNEGRPLLPHENPFGGNEGLPKWMKQEIPAHSFRDDDLVTRIALEIEEAVHPDVMMVYLSGIDKVSHNTWGALEPAESYPPHIRFTEAEREATIAALEDYYVYTDELIGRLIEPYGPDDLIMIVSDHGFEAQLLVVWLTGGHETNEAIDGVLFARGSKVPRGKRVTGTAIADITPSILAWLGLPVGNDMYGRVAAFLDIPSVTRIPSHDDIPIERVGDDRGEVEDTIMDQLRGLGYVE